MKLLFAPTLTAKQAILFGVLIIDNPICFSVSFGFLLFSITVVLKDNKDASAFIRDALARAEKIKGVSDNARH